MSLFRMVSCLWKWVSFSSLHWEREGEGARWRDWECVFIDLFLPFPLKLTIIHILSKPTRVVGDQASIRLLLQWTGVLGLGPSRELETGSDIGGLQLGSDGASRADKVHRAILPAVTPLRPVQQTSIWPHCKSCFISNGLKVTADLIWASASC